ncbi:hypothetical protein MMC25_007196 [Agyrium rufum]|nr:hypothetical protein [Agyrium rufum]
MATLVLPYLPPNILLVFDFLSLTTSPRFRGFHSIPPGWHFILTAPSSAFSVRQGLWLHIDGKILNASNHGRKGEGSHDDRTRNDHHGLVKYSVPDVKKVSESIILRWSVETESLHPVSPSSSDPGLENYLSSTPASSLIPYTALPPGSLDTDSPNRNIYPDVTSFVDLHLLRHLTSSPESCTNFLPISSSSTSLQDMETIPGLSHEQVSDILHKPSTGESQPIETNLGFLDIDMKRTWREGAVGRERTEGARDRSWALETLVEHWGSSPEIPKLAKETDVRIWGYFVLGQLQACFLMALLLGNYACQQEWKRIVEVILTSKNCLMRRESFFVKAIEVLESQLKAAQEIGEEGSEGMFEFRDGDIGEGAWLRRVIGTFERNVIEIFHNSPEEIPKLPDKLEDFKDFVEMQYGWSLVGNWGAREVVFEDGETVGVGGDRTFEDDEEEEKGEFAPVIVDLGDQDG